MVRLASLCPIQAAITAVGTALRCINVAQVCLAACNLMCRSPHTDCQRDHQQASSASIKGEATRCRAQDPSSVCSLAIRNMVCEKKAAAGHRAVGRATGLALGNYDGRRGLMSTMSEQLAWIEESESTYVAQSRERRYVISKQSDGQWAVGLSDGGALFSAKVNKPRLAATLAEAEQIAQGWQSGFGL